MAHHGRNLLFVYQPVGHRHRLLGFAGVIPLHQHDLLALDAARRVDICRRLGCPFPVLCPVGCVGAGERPGYADGDIRLRIKRSTQAAQQSKR